MINLKLTPTKETQRKGRRLRGLEFREKVKKPSMGYLPGCNHPSSTTQYFQINMVFYGSRRVKRAVEGQ